MQPILIATRCQKFIFKCLHTRTVRNCGRELSALRRQVAYPLSCLGIEKNVHVAYRLNASKLVRSYSQALALLRRDKGKPAAKRGRKAYGPLVRR